MMGWMGVVASTRLCWAERTEYLGGLHYEFHGSTRGGGWRVLSLTPTRYEQAVLQSYLFESPQARGVTVRGDFIAPDPPKDGNAYRWEL